MVINSLRNNCDKNTEDLQAKNMEKSEWFLWRADDDGHYLVVVPDIRQHFGGIVFGDDDTIQVDDQDEIGMQKDEDNVKSSMLDWLFIEYEHDGEEHKPNAGECEWLDFVVAGGNIQNVGHQINAAQNK